jgi:hypothetical protein
MEELINPRNRGNQSVNHALQFFSKEMVAAIRDLIASRNAHSFSATVREGWQRKDQHPLEGFLLQVRKWWETRASFRSLQSGEDVLQWFERMQQLFIHFQLEVYFSQLVSEAITHEKERRKAQECEKAVDERLKAIEEDPNWKKEPKMKKTNTLRVKSIGSKQACDDASKAMETTRDTALAFITENPSQLENYYSRVRDFRIDIEDPDYYRYVAFDQKILEDVVDTISTFTDKRGALRKAYALVLKLRESHPRPLSWMLKPGWAGQDFIEQLIGWLRGKFGSASNSLSLVAAVYGLRLTRRNASVMRDVRNFFTEGMNIAKGFIEDSLHENSDESDDVLSDNDDGDDENRAFMSDDSHSEDEDLENERSGSEDCTEEGEKGNEKKN